MKRILVLRGGALGDFIVTLPALALLRERWPAARIELAGNATAAQLALNRGLIDAVHSQHEARWAALFDDAPLRDDFRAWLTAFDLVLNYWPDPDATLRKRFPLRDDQRFLWAPAMPARAPAAAHYCEPLRTLGLHPKNHFHRLAPLPAADRVTKRAHPEKGYVAIHPGSGSRRKNWPVENWRKLIALLPPPVSLILGEAELPDWSAITAEHPPEPAGNRPLVLAQRPLEELVSHFAACRLFVGHDSGISHLAAACGVPSVLLFGPTDPGMWAPPAPEVHVLRCGPGMDLPIEAVWRTVQAVFGDRK